MGRSRSNIDFCSTIQGRIFKAEFSRQGFGGRGISWSGLESSYMVRVI